MAYAFYNSKKFCLNENNVNTLIKHNKTLSEILLSHAYALFCIRLGLLFDLTLPDQQKKVLNFIYYHSLKIGNRVIANYGTEMSLKQVADTLDRNIRNDRLHLKDKSIIDKIRYIDRQYCNTIFSNFLNGKKSGKVYHKLKVDCKRQFLNTIKSNKRVKGAAGLMQDAVRILTLGHNVLFM